MTAVIIGLYVLATVLTIVNVIVLRRIKAERRRLVAHQHAISQINETLLELASQAARCES